ncbi:2,3-diaminopropionate biosynthesis protein SbnA [Paenibacillus sp. GCM10027627]|uniref:2,3-diaminopropionate biosynthesis protein SbnA n=1 Tax=unclassified Paenibacillus TaxID=185978 RepID=UPI00363E51DF
MSYTNKSVSECDHPSILNFLGNTPVVQLDMNEDGMEHVQVFAKLEYYNPTGSVKDRAAQHLLQKLRATGEINPSTIIIESSSGNFGISLATFCKFHNQPFYCVIDPLISPINEMLIRKLSTKVYKVTERDENGGYLLNRIRLIQQLMSENNDMYWINQYKNPYNAEAYYHSLGNEILEQFDELDYLFVGVSSGGTVSGLSCKIKEERPNCKIIAVDVDGSIVFGGAAKKRFIPGIGSSMVPEIIKSAKIDEVVCVDEFTSVQHCHELLKTQHLFAGGSSGSVLAAIKKYFKENKISGSPKVLGIFCDRGDRYATTIYHEGWVAETFSALYAEQADLCLTNP